MVDLREEVGVSREQEEEAIISKEKQLEKQKTKKKAKAKEPEPAPKVPTKDIPYPNRMKVDHSKHLYDAFADALGKLCFELPLAEAILVPTYTKFVRDILKRRPQPSLTLIPCTTARLHSKPPRATI
jgi:hypothetical protein